jgi:hypothetical protein
MLEDRPGLVTLPYLSQRGELNTLKFAVQLESSCINACTEHHACPMQHSICHLASTAVSNTISPHSFIKYALCFDMVVFLHVVSVVFGCMHVVIGPDIPCNIILSYLKPIGV